MREQPQVPGVKPLGLHLHMLHPSSAGNRALLGGFVLGLPEPYRTTVLLRYYEGLTAEAIASAQEALAAFGAPAATNEGLASAENLDVVWMWHPPAQIDLMQNVPG